MYLSDPANAGHRDKCWWSLNGRITFMLHWRCKVVTPHVHCHTSFQRYEGQRQRGQGVAVKSGEQRSYLGLSESFSFSKFAAGAA